LIKIKIIVRITNDKNLLPGITIGKPVAAKNEFL
jgi:hypothetical protein